MIFLFTSRNLNFFNEKIKPCPQLNDIEWLWDLAILTDITYHLNLLNLKLQGKEKRVSILFGTVKSFQNKSSLFLNQIKKFDFSHFERCATLIKKDCGVFLKQWYIDIINKLKHEFANRFKDITVHGARSS